jgi:hypothetical protein
MERIIQIFVLWTIYQAHCTATSVSSGNVAILYGETETFTVGINILMPSDLTARVISSIQSAPISPSLKEARIRIVQKLGELHDEAVKRDMTELNKLRVYDAYSDFFTTANKASLSCKDTESGGKCEEPVRDSSVTPPKPIDFLGEVLMQQPHSHGSAPTRKKRSVASLLKSIGQVVAKSSGKVGSVVAKSSGKVGSVVAKAPGKVWTAIRKHPFRSLLTTIDVVTGGFEVYDILDNHFLSSTASAEELSQYYSDMRENDLAVRNLSSNMYLMMGETKRRLVEMQKEMIDSLGEAETWSDQLSVLASILTTMAARIRDGLSSVSRGVIPYTIASPESIATIQQLLLPVLSQHAMGQLAYPVKLLYCDPESRTLWVGIRNPSVLSSVIGRVYHAAGTVSKDYSGNQLCFTYSESSYFFAPFLNGSELDASHSMDPSACTVTSGLWLCSFRTLSEFSPNTQRRVCWENNKSEREKQSVTLVDKEDHLAKILKLSEFPVGKVN